MKNDINVTIFALNFLIFCLVPAASNGSSTVRKSLKNTKIIEYKVRHKKIQRNYGLLLIVIKQNKTKRLNWLAK